MAHYKYSQFLQQLDHVAFDQIHQPGIPAPYSGIYRCEVCGAEITEVVGRPLPPQNHHQHPQRQPIRWRLTVSHKA
jgi:hypothetical protein